ncbi:MAG: PIN domain-containing protein [Patescibacteria group bacterium]
MIFVDTNYFLRFFLGEPYDQATHVKTLFQKAARGDVELGTSVVVFFEVYWVASSFYQVDEEKIAEFLQNMLKMEFIRLENRPILIEAVSLYRGMNFDLEDAYNLAFARTSRAKEFATFDVKLKKKSLEILKGTV